MLGEDIAAGRRRLQDHGRAARRVRPRPRPRHPDLRAGDPRGGDGGGDDRHPVIAEIMFSDFLAVCWDIVANEIAKSRYMTNGQVTFPLVIRTANGGGVRFGAQHSQSVENWAMMIPGLKVVAPSTPPGRGRADGGLDPGSRPGRLLRAQGADGHEGRGARRRDRRRARHGEGGPGGHRRHDRRARARWCRARSRRPSACSSTASRPRSSTSARWCPLDTRTLLDVGRARPAGSSRSRRTPGCAGGAPSSSRSSPRRPSGTSTARASASPRRTSRCPRRPRSRTSRCRRSTGSTRRSASPSTSGGGA